MLGKNENECEYAFLPSNVSQKSYYSVYSETLYGPIILTKSLINCQKSYHSVYGETLYGPIILTKSLINCFVDSNFIRKS